MSDAVAIPPVFAGLVISPLEEDGQYVVKDPRHDAYFRLGAQEVFLLEQLDGARTAAAVRAAFERGSASRCPRRSWTSSWCSPGLGGSSIPPGPRRRSPGRKPPGRPRPDPARASWPGASASWIPIGC